MRSSMAFWRSLSFIRPSWLPNGNRDRVPMRNRQRESHRRPDAHGERYPPDQSDPRHPLTETVGALAGETLVDDDRTGEYGINGDAPESALQRSVHSRRSADDRHF